MEEILGDQGLVSVNISEKLSLPENGKLWQHWQRHSTWWRERRQRGGERQHQDSTGSSEGEEGDAQAASLTGEHTFARVP